MAERPVSPYLAPGFYDTALAKGRHRDIVGGRWEETGRVQMAALLREGLQPDDRLLDIGAGSLRLGCKAVPYLAPGNYWATDASGALMSRGRALELADPARLPADHLVEDADFAFPGVPGDIDMAICFAVFTHLPADRLPPALARIRAAFPRLRKLLVTLFLAPDDHPPGTPCRQPDGVVTHDVRPPYHRRLSDVLPAIRAAGFDVRTAPDLLPRGQILFVATPVPTPF
ncbi:class I SAM-dependent methyltransferase [Mesobacterium sp. TK19101]|uniref:Class I SAM-dependent methyltransferase n=1 Tax=Mesobacterium hydrothermale TaxID=3111907 RepID=A0ABU6HFH3_9RHOB|nr:class I SAM-dependent methyltransferase [Mesobacterium sp. TK19101]MEC3859835.1 class I SAM-dependent methyltransferase [Mesobacterium sp. TK19101]